MRPVRYAGTLHVVYDALNSSASEVIITDRDGTIVYANPSFLRIFGYREKAEVLSRNAADLFTLQEVENFSGLKGIIGKVKGKSGEFFAQHKDGTLFPVEVSYSMVTDGTGIVLGMMASFIDITERKRFEDELRQSEGQLRTLSRKLFDSQELERKRIARELYDGLGATLTNIKYSLEQLLDDYPEEKESLEHAVSLVQSAIKDTARIARRLRPSILDDMGVFPAIRWFCRQYQDDNGGLAVGTRLEVQEEEVFNPLKTAVYRILQETLTNAAKHSGAHRVIVGLKKTEGNLIILSIEDDGRGFGTMDLNGKATGSDDIRGMGLTSMKERANLSGGCLAIMPRKGSGTIIEAK